MFPEYKFEMEQGANEAFPHPKPVHVNTDWDPEVLL